MKAVYIVYDTDFWLLTVSYEMETGVSQFENLDVVHTDRPCNGWNKAGKGNSENDVFYLE